MKLLGRKTVVEYTYDSEEEAERHEYVMKNQGWFVFENKNFFKKHYRSYYQPSKVGVFL